MIQRYPQFWFFMKDSAAGFSFTFWVWFFKKNVFYVVFYWLTKFHGPLLLEILGNMCIVIIRDLACGVIKFKTNLSILIIKPFSYMTTRVWAKTYGLIVWTFLPQVEISTRYNELKKIELYEKFQPAILVIIFWHFLII